MFGTMKLAVIFLVLVERAVSDVPDGAFKEGFGQFQSANRHFYIGNVNTPNGYSGYPGNHHMHYPLPPYPVPPMPFPFPSMPFPGPPMPFPGPPMPFPGSSMPFPGSSMPFPGKSMPFPGPPMPFPMPYPVSVPYPVNAQQQQANSGQSALEKFPQAEVQLAPVTGNQPVLGKEAQSSFDTQETLVNGNQSNGQEHYVVTSGTDVTEVNSEGIPVVTIESPKVINFGGLPMVIQDEQNTADNEMMLPENADVQNNFGKGPLSDLIEMGKLLLGT